jgi:hypothetical protein
MLRKSRKTAPISVNGARADFGFVSPL